MADGANSKGRELIKSWQHALKSKEEAYRAQRRAEIEEAETRKALIEWLKPKDAQPGETFGIWDRDRHDNEALFEVRDDEINVRYRK